MNSKLLVPIILHTIILLFVQIFLLINLSFPFLDRYSINFFIYPLIIIILPFRTSRPAQITSAFVFGLILDFFYNSPGLHSGTFVFSTFLRSSILKFFEPRGGYRIDNSPTIGNYGLSWFLSYSAMFLFLHLLIYFSFDAFSFVFIDKIFVNTLVSFIASYALIVLYQIIIRH